MLLKLGVVGSRRRNTEDDLFLLADELEHRVDLHGLENIILVSGGCPQGADHFAEIIHAEFQFPKPMVIHYPDKSQLDINLMYSNPRMAYAIINYARNTLIARDSDELIALVASDRKGGTEDTIKKFLKMGKTKVTLL